MLFKVVLLPWRCCSGLLSVAKEAWTTNKIEMSVKVWEFRCSFLLTQARCTNTATSGFLWWRQWGTKAHARYVKHICVNRICCKLIDWLRLCSINAVSAIVHYGVVLGTNNVMLGLFVKHTLVVLVKLAYSSGSKNVIWILRRYILRTLAAVSWLISPRR